MIRLTNSDARALVALLEHAQTALREYALYQAYRRDACKAMRERILADYHHRQWTSAIALADDVTDAGGALLARLDAASAAA